MYEQFIKFKMEYESRVQKNMAFGYQTMLILFSASYPEPRQEADGFHKTPKSECEREREKRIGPMFVYKES
jgi:hypothetical protein